MRAWKGSPYDGGHRVPCFIHWPAGGLRGGWDVTQLTAHFDLLPTLAETCSLRQPEAIAVEGRSLVPLLRRNTESWKDRTLVVHFPNQERPQKWLRSAVMTDRWRLVDGKELYDIAADPGQKRDLAASQEAVVRQLRAAYEAWWASISPRFDEYNPSFYRCSARKTR